ncbi:MAG: PAS domain S-box protein [Candidatus Moduliflexus flocculans]|nr:PAS domain S-box protein [Candidatus Moduliflexus flocculans]
MTRIFHYPLGLYRTTPQGQILDAAPTLARMLGYPDVQALKAVSFWDIHHDPRDRESWQAVLDSSPMVEIFETQLRRSNGTLFWAKDSSRAAKDSRGNVLFYDGVIEDISRKKQMEEEHSWDVRLQASVGDVSERLLSTTPIEEMSAVVLEHARRLTSSATAFVGIVGEGTQRLVPAALTPDARELLSEYPGGDGALHGNSGMWRWILEKQRPILTNMTSLDPRFTGMPEWHIPVRQFLAVPAVMSGSDRRPDRRRQRGGALRGEGPQGGRAPGRPLRHRRPADPDRGRAAGNVARRRADPGLQPPRLHDPGRAADQGGPPDQEGDVPLLRRPRRSQKGQRRLRPRGRGRRPRRGRRPSAGGLPRFRHHRPAGRGRVRRPGHRRRRGQGDGPRPPPPREGPGQERPPRRRVSDLLQPGDRPLRTRPGPSRSRSSWPRRTGRCTRTSRRRRTPRRPPDGGRSPQFRIPYLASLL